MGQPIAILTATLMGVLTANPIGISTAMYYTALQTATATAMPTSKVTMTPTASPSHRHTNSVAHGSSNFAAGCTDGDSDSIIETADFLIVLANNSNRNALDSNGITGATKFTSESLICNLFKKYFVVVNIFYQPVRFGPSMSFSSHEKLYHFRKWLITFAL